MFKLNSGFKKRFSIPVCAIFVFIIILLVLILYSFLTYEETNVKTRGYYIESSNLEKIDLQMKVNETYTYFVSSFEDFNATYTILQEEDCLYIKESFLEENNLVCLDKKGLYPNKFGSNVIYNSPMFMFKPWMLAVKENWNWTVIYVFDFEGNVDISKYLDLGTGKNIIYFKTVGEETIFGRETYKVEISAGQTKEYYWIDKEKRILIKKEGIENIILIKAPFKLLQQLEE